MVSSNTVRLRIIWLAALGVAAPSAFAAVTLIDANTRNGGFETGAVTPWEGGAQLVEDAAFASQGNWYSVLHSGVSRKLAYQFIPASSIDGLVFQLSFDARSGAVGFDSVYPQLSAANLDGSFLAATASPFSITGLASSQWQTYQARFEFPNVWNDDRGLTFALEFYKNNAVSGTDYVGYLDGVTLQQVPEPGTLPLILMGTALCAGAIYERSRKRVESTYGL